MKKEQKWEAPKVPCGSCPYRRDVPSGIWTRDEYDKLPLYDGETWEQCTRPFFCHQQDGKLCGGWLACHGPQELLAIRIAELKPGRVSPEVLDYASPVPVFSSGKEARDHGVRGIRRPGPRAKSMVAGIMRKRRKLP